MVRSTFSGMTWLHVVAVFGAAVALAVAASGTPSGTVKEPRFIGSSKCKNCHEKEEKRQSVRQMERGASLSSIRGPSFRQSQRSGRRTRD